MKLTALDVAKYFLTKSDEEAGEYISNLKLQKLLYYAQGCHLALHEKPLFDDLIEAWQHGPVVASVYHEFKDNGSKAISPLKSDSIDLDFFDQDTMDFLDEIYSNFGQYSAWKLRTMTHEEPPWKDAVKSPSASSVISHESMKSFFKTQISE